MAVGHNFEKEPANFGLNLFSGFIGEDLIVQIYYRRWTTNDGKISHGLWLSELKKRFQYFEHAVCFIFKLRWLE